LREDQVTTWKVKDQTVLSQAHDTTQNDSLKSRTGVISNQQ
jgi:hypothetical protein